MSDLPSRKRFEAEGETNGFRVNQRMLLGGLIVVLLAIFILSNTEEANVEFLTIRWTVPLWFVLTLNVLLGAAAGVLFVRVRARRQSKQR